MTTTSNVNFQGDEKYFANFIKNDKETGKVSFKIDSLKNADQAHAVVQKATSMATNQKFKAIALTVAAVAGTIALVAVAFAISSLISSALFSYLAAGVPTSGYYASSWYEAYWGYAEYVSNSSFLSKLGTVTNVIGGALVLPLAGFAAYKLIKKYALPSIQSHFNYAAELSNQAEQAREVRNKFYNEVQ